MTAPADLPGAVVIVKSLVLYEGLWHCSIKKSFGILLALSLSKAA
jgi:hypothetical protein